MTDFCYYHPSKEAFGKCSQCGKLICMADSQQVTGFQRYYAGHTSGHSGSSGTPIYGQTAYQQMYCTPCNTKRILETTQSMKKLYSRLWIVLIVFAIFSVVITLVVFNIESILESFGISITINVSYLGITFGAFFGIILCILCMVLGVCSSSKLKNNTKVVEQALQIQKDFEKTLP